MTKPKKELNGQNAMSHRISGTSDTGGSAGTQPPCREGSNVKRASCRPKRRGDSLRGVATRTVAPALPRGLPVSTPRSSTKSQQMPTPLPGGPLFPPNRLSCHWVRATAYPAEPGGRAVPSGQPPPLRKDRPAGAPGKL